MSDVETARQFVKDFREKQKHLMGDISVVATHDGREIQLDSMTDDEATEAADILMGIGNPTRFGALGNKK